MAVKRSFFALPVLIAVLAIATLPAFAVKPHAGMLRYPDVSATHITFLYANDLWIVPKEGGTALPLASPPGAEGYARFSPDGKTIAFMGNYDGNLDLYTIPVEGGIPFRVTYHPFGEVLCDWTPDERLIYFAIGSRDYPRASELFTVAAGGGIPVKMPVPYGAVGSISPDGQWLAYTPHTRDHRTWKRYRGGMATDIWLFHLTEFTSKKITDWEGTDSFPMWHDGKIYYLSDAGPNHRLNIWVYDIEKDTRKQVTKYKEYDVKWPSIGPGSEGQGEIVYQNGSELHLLDLGTEKAATIEVIVPGDRPRLRVQSENAADLIFSRNISSTGKRIVVGARGDIWTIPAKKGSPMNLTRTSGIAERYPVWSPDGKWIAYSSDESGEYELYIKQSDGRGETRKLTHLKAGYLYWPVWSPDSKWITFWDQAGHLYLQDVEGEKTRTVDRWENAWGRGRSPVSWSKNSKWLTYHRSENIVTPICIWLYDVENDKKHKVTSGMFNDTWPTFDREGKYLYFASQREISSPIYEDLGTTWIYTQTDRLYVVPLTVDVESPLAPKSDDETWDKKDEDKADEGDEKDKKDEKGEEGEGEKKEEETDKDKEPEAIKIDIDGFETRAIALPVERGNFFALGINDQGKLVFSRGPARGDEFSITIQLLDLDEDKDSDKVKTIISGVTFSAMSSDGKKLLVANRGGAMAIVDTKPKQEMKDMVSTAGMTARIDPREEWRQIFNEAWRVQRDFFYDPNMHGVNWNAVKRQYEAMLDDCASREDVSYIIREMISELNVGHAYYFGGDIEHAPSVPIGMPGCEFTLDSGAYKVTKIYEGGAWDVDGRGPLSQPGVDVKVGDYLLAVNGVPIDVTKGPYAAFQGLSDRTVTLTVSETPKMDDKARYVLVTLMSPRDEYMLRYRAWVEKNRAYVEEKSEGRIGYLYVPNTSIFGQNELVRQFFGQLKKDALIIDERWNGGGQIPTRFIELLNRPVANYWATRYAEESIPWPPDAHHGPKCMLINGLAGSGGDYFPWWFREAGVGKLIGTRTWGGLVGMSGNPQLIDGGYTSAPTFGFFEVDGTWGIEGHGVDPDIEVVDDPALMMDGSDPQIDAAIEHLKDELKRRPHIPPHKPRYPDRSGMGITDEDH